MNYQTLRIENAYFQGTPGVSAHCVDHGFCPAFRDMTTGRVEAARFKNGDLAPIHLIEGLPMEWAVTYAPDGAITEIKPGIVSGFVRGTRFYTREEVIAIG